ncbi:G-protein alpha subunit-domain-containing protein [Aspergillus flavus]|uniref:G-protein alpha subunit-domain-containing protein n=1 Tax=Aspergillus flavus (strain ATCC 200026 / FGSC A1120 / IAM 13836 / NRRL 3357 / JCM 12722 / SRRC 167) TaxID=332952 RepID=A0A7U2MCW7_ASPFN|nr:uncharacterized protein G4B84_002326 [Aspergillus flavus NRRL3357]QMW27037.1 hypothetical protein G4B84_002326 [Aspergillus flavus NRRL3357]QRD81381.1 G-protein alpha subunit-domain-containing protein [Aspergillus flavus]
MADPVSIIGTAGALANIIQIVSQTIVAIRDLQSDWNDADLTFLSLTSQLSALRLALTKIEEWMGTDTGDAHHQLVMDLDDSINCCKVLLKKLKGLVDSLQQKQNEALSFQSKIKLVFGRKSIDDIQKLLEHQTNALNLLLTACNCQTGAEQKALLVRSSSRKVLRQMNLDSASLIVHRDTDSIATQITDHLSKLSFSFSFDREVFTSNVYERFFRGLTRRVLRYPQNNDAPAVERPRETSLDDEWQLSRQAFLLFGGDYSDTDTILQEILGSGDKQTINVSLELQRSAVYRFVIQSAQSIIASLKHAGIKLHCDSSAVDCDLLLDYIDDLGPTNRLDVSVGEAIRSLTHDPCMERIRQSPREFNISDSALSLFDDIDRIASPDYNPTSRDVQIVRDRTSVVIELHVTYKRRRDAWKEGKPEAILLDVHLLDVTLRFGSNGAYNFNDISTIFLLVNPAGYHEVFQNESLETSLVPCKSKFEAMLRSSWFPQDKRIAVLFSEPAESTSNLAACPFTEYISGFTGNNEPDAITQFLSRHFQKLRPKQFLLGVGMGALRGFPGESVIEKLLLVSEVLLSI